MAARNGQGRGLAGQLERVAPGTDNAVDVAEDRECQVLVAEAQGAGADQVAPPVGWL